MARYIATFADYDREIVNLFSEDNIPCYVTIFKKDKIELIVLIYKAIAGQGVKMVFGEDIHNI